MGEETRLETQLFWSHLGLQSTQVLMYHRTSRGTKFPHNDDAKSRFTTVIFSIYFIINVFLWCCSAHCIFWLFSFANHIHCCLTKSHQLQLYRVIMLNIFYHLSGIFLWASLDFSHLLRVVFWWYELKMLLQQICGMSKLI